VCYGVGVELGDFKMSDIVFDKDLFAVVKKYADVFVADNEICIAPHSGFIADLFFPQKQQSKPGGKGIWGGK
jgi:hypothetical protein